MANDNLKYGELIKSVSTFTIKRKHQDTNGGEIFERDISTIGEQIYVGEDKRPVFRSGNFVITSSNERTTPMPPVDASWELSPVGDDDFWTWSDVEDVSEEDDTSMSLEINPDVYDLRTFAYYGSCVELIRASLNHIIATFPGELYASDQKLTYIKGRGTANEEYVELGGGNKTIVDNPFGLDIHSPYVDAYFIENEPLKYILANKFYEDNYVFYTKDDDTAGTGRSIFNISYDKKTGNCKNGRKDEDGNLIDFEPYSLMRTITVSYDGGTQTIEVWKLKGDEYAYLSSNVGWHIRPKSKHYKEFRGKLGFFEKTLLSESTLPKYSPSFEIYSISDYGFDSQMQQFSFPTGPGGYNLGINTLAYNLYVSKLSKIAEIYDEHFCDNLYRVMTHEAIQNFDWSFSREKNPNAESEYAEGGTKFQKILRVIAREFDDIKLYAEGIGQANKVTYGGNANSPDYLLTDIVESLGWAYKHIIPFTVKTFEYPNKDNKEISLYPEIDTFTTILTPYMYDPDTDGCSDKKDLIEPVKTHTNKTEYSPNDVNNLFSRLLALNSKSIWRKKGTADGIDSLLSLFGLKNKKWVESFYDTRYGKYGFKPNEDCIICPDREKYSTLDHTIGVGSEIGNISKSLYDYEIKEYTYHVDPIELTKCERDKWGISVNTNKNISYSEDANINLSTKTAWRGLLVKEKEQKNEDGNITGYVLYPYFDKNKENDGNPYYQMYGGWLNSKIRFYDKTEVYLDENGKDKTIVVDDILVSEENSNNYFDETITKIRGVENIKELMNIPLYDLHDGDYCYVVDLSKRYIIIDGIAYDLYEYTINNEVKENWYYINATVKNSSILLGRQIYANSLHVYEPSNNDVGYEHKIKPLSSYKDNTNIKIFAYRKEENDDYEWVFTLEDEYGNKAMNTVVIEPEYFGYTIPSEDINTECACNPCLDLEPITDLVNGMPTHYFKLHNKTFSYIINGVNKENGILKRDNTMGWNQLSETDDEYKYIKSIHVDYAGNNPHTHSVKSDCGAEYLRYFANIFKYAAENELFNLGDLIDTWVGESDRADSCLDPTIDEFLGKLYSFGFEKNLFNDDNLCTLKDPYGTIDTEEELKIHVSESDEKDETNSYFVTDYPDKEEIDSDCIINTKIVEIKFYNCTVDGKVNPKLKYFNKVVIPYLAQVLPSSLIVKITYDEDN